MPVQSLPRSAESYHRDQRAEIGAAVSAVQRQWRRMGSEFDASYGGIEGSLLATVTTAQERVAAGAAEYVPAVLAETGQSRADRPAAVVTTTPLVGYAGDGRPVEGLLYGAVVHAKEQVATQATPRQALASAGQWLTMATGTLLSDTGRAAESLEIGVRPIGGFVRMLTPPSCSRCVVLAGRWYRKNAGFARHPGCFPAGAVVSGPLPEAATRRWYEGELAIIRTASGKELTATGNHPVLTDQGWVPASLLKVGDRVLSSTRPDGAVPLVIPDEKQAPARIEDLWGSDGMVPLGKVPTTAEDFHGDGGHGEVDVVLPDRLLGHGSHAALDELVEEVLLSGGVDATARLARKGSGKQLLVGVADAAHGGMSGSGLADALLGGHLRRADLPGVGPSADLDALLGEALSDHVATGAVAAAQAVLTLTGLVGAHDLGGRQGAPVPRWDAPAGALSTESRAAYASRGSDLGTRLSGQVAADRVVKAERVEWSGHVYNLTSSEGWYSANGFIVSNCDCRSIPASESVAGDLRVDGFDYVDSLTEADQDRLLGHAGAEAWRSGADLNQIVNARRGMRTAQIGGRDVLVTTEGTTRRGWAYRRLGVSGQTDVRQDITRFGQTRATRVRSARRPRLMPETALSIAKNREDYLRLLRANGYILR